MVLSRVSRVGIARLTQRVACVWSASREANTGTTDTGYDVIMMSYYKDINSKFLHECIHAPAMHIC